MTRRLDVAIKIVRNQPSIPKTKYRERIPYFTYLACKEEETSVHCVISSTHADAFTSLARLVTKGGGLWQTVVVFVLVTHLFATHANRAALCACLRFLIIARCPLYPEHCLSHRFSDD